MKQSLIAPLLLQLESATATAVLGAICFALLIGIWSLLVLLEEPDTGAHAPSLAEMAGHAMLATFALAAIVFVFFTTLLAIWW